MPLPPPDGSRDRRIEDPTNLWIIHPAGRFLLPWFVARGVSANSVSVAGLSIGALAALAYSKWDSPPYAIAGLVLSMAWLIADGLDGMIARATGTASPLGRFLDGLCDHGVFLLIYLALAWSIGAMDAWALAACAGLAHAVQSNFYESERTRFHRRRKGAAVGTPALSGNPLVRLYDRVSELIESSAAPFEEALRAHPRPAELGAAYGANVTKPLRLLSLLSANVRVYAIFIACIARDPRLFWWFELLPLTAILVIGVYWHRRLECRLIRNTSTTKRSVADSPVIPSEGM